MREAEEDMEGEREEGLEESSSSSPHCVFGAVVSWLTSVLGGDTMTDS